MDRLFLLCCILSYIVNYRYNTECIFIFKAVSKLAIFEMCSTKMQDSLITKSLEYEPFMSFVMVCGHYQLPCMWICSSYSYFIGFKISWILTGLYYALLRK